MDPSYAANIFLHWAQNEGLAALESNPPPILPFPGVHPLNGVSQEGKAILRDRLVQSVAVNAAEHQIVVFLKKLRPGRTGSG